MIRGVLTKIQQSDGPILPMDGHTPSTADVMPAHQFEAHWENGRFLSDIVSTIGDAKGKKPATSLHRMTRVKAFRAKSNLPELSFTILSVGR